MKRLCFVCMCLLLIGTASPAIADLDGIQIISESYSVSGGYDVDIYPQEYWDESWHSASYNLGSSDSSGISGSVSMISFPYAYAESSAGRFYVNAEAGDDYLFMGPYAIATASWSFQPMTSGWLHAELSLWSYHGMEAYAILSDSTTDVTLLDGHGYNLPEAIHADFWVYDTHQYSLFFYAHSQQCDASGVRADLSFTPVPEPATLLLLGLGAVIVRKRR